MQYVQAIFQSHSELNLTLQGAVQMAMIGRYYERVGDHAVNIGERVLYMVTGWMPEKTGSARQRLREAEASTASELLVEELLDEPGDDRPDDIDGGDRPEG